MSAEAVKAHPAGRCIQDQRTSCTGARTSEQVYTAICATCHATGAAGSPPKVGDNGAWVSAYRQGWAVLMTKRHQGLNATPVRGGAPDLTDDEVGRAVAPYTKSGGSFAEPQVAGAAADAAAKADPATKGAKIYRPDVRCPPLPPAPSWCPKMVTDSLGPAYRQGYGMHWSPVASKGLNAMPPKGVIVGPMPSLLLRLNT